MLKIKREQSIYIKDRGEILKNNVYTLHMKKHFSKNMEHNK